MKSEKVIGNNGDTYWYKPGTKTLHREDGPAKEYSNGDKYWYQNGKRHREDGPAIELADGDKCWYINGKLHREDGPAVEYIYYNNEYWFNDTIINVKSNEDFKRILKLKGFM